MEGRQLNHLQVSLRSTLATVTRASFVFGALASTGLSTILLCIVALGIIIGTPQQTRRLWYEHIYFGFLVGSVLGILGAPLSMILLVAFTGPIPARLLVVCIVAGVIGSAILGVFGMIAGSVNWMLSLIRPYSSTVSSTGSMEVDGEGEK